MDQTATAAQLTFLAQGQQQGSHPRSTSSLFLRIARSRDPAISLRMLSARLGDRGFGLLVLLFALPNSIPLPLPGVSTLTSLPLIFLAGQLCFGQRKIWLPDWLADRQIPMDKLRPLIRHSLPWLRRLEKLVKPRREHLTTDRYERLAGALILVLALLLALPVPLGNLPLGLAIAILALAITERDGQVMIIGWLLTFFALCFFLLLVSGYAWLVWQLISGIF